jgi:hypothetical protein
MPFCYIADLFLATEFFNFFPVSRTCALFSFVFESLQCTCFNHSVHLTPA